MVKKIILVAVVMFMLSDFSALAQSRGFGIGIILGEPTGLSGKYWTSSYSAFDFGLGYSFVKETRFHAHMDYVFHTQLSSVPENFMLYYGPGARLKLRENADSRFGMRGVVGFVWIPRDVRIDVFLELAPILDLVPATEFSINGGLGLRFFLN
ncbi:MAG: hypothetical protein HXY49_06725 [Ignavibacteriaceae bacterium]|jgi:hypothetical protein|nr:hypothetical protein [Ignavibacteriaceae bacterium]